MKIKKSYNQGKNHPQWKGGKIKRICKNCNKEFLYDKCHLKREGRGSFCSTKCKGIHQKKSNLGKNNPNYNNHTLKGKFKGQKSPNWKGGITPIAMLIRKSDKYKQWRSDVFIRDNFTCQKCGARSGIGKVVYIEAHHKTSFSKLIQEVKEYMPLINFYDACMLYTPLWDLANGITLCKKCHNKTKKWGIRKQKT